MAQTNEEVLAELRQLDQQGRLQSAADGLTYVNFLESMAEFARQAGYQGLVVVADDPQIETWGHERNQQFADLLGVPYVQNIERALSDYEIDVAIVSPEAERHCDLSIRAARLGKHVIQDKPVAVVRSEAERLVLNLHHVDGLSLREVAAVFDLPLARIAALYTAALSRLHPWPAATSPSLATVPARVERAATRR